MSTSLFTHFRTSIGMRFLSAFLILTLLLTLRPVVFAASLSISGSLAENTLNGATVSLTLTDDTFVDSTLQNGNFVLNNAPSGVSINSVSHVSPTSANLTLAFNGTDFDSNVSNFNITVNGAELTTGANLSSNNLTITAVQEASPTLTISGSLAENNLNSTSLSISLGNETFKDNTLDKNNFTLNNAPSGTIVSSVSYGSSTSATLSFSFNNTDFDSNITNFNITVSGSELTGNTPLTSNNLTITAVQESSGVTISGNLTETNLDGASVALTLSNDTFKDNSLSKSNFTLNNAPSGTTIDSVAYNSTTSATLTLDFTGTDFDSNVTNFAVVVSSNELTSNANVISNNLTITAVQEGSDTTKPTISSVALSSSQKVVTITMSENINRVGSASDLKSKIRFAYDGSNYETLDSDVSVTDINGTDKKLIITFDDELTGTKNRIKILAGAIKDAAGNQNNELTTGSISETSAGSSSDDTTKPTIDDVMVDHTLRTVTIVFSEDIENPSSLSALKSKIKFAANGTSFSALASNDTIENLDGDTNQLRITFDNELEGNDNKIRIESGAVEDASGNKNNELTTSSFDAEDSEKPYIKSASLDSSKKVVTITFQEDVDMTDTVSTLKNKIKLATDGSDFESLESDDTVSELNGDNVLKVTFDTALSGSKNKIRIASGAVEDEEGNKNAELTTDALSAGGTSSSDELRISEVEVEENGYKVILVLSEDVERVGSLDDLKDAISFAADGSDFESLADDDEVDLDDNELTIVFDSAISGAKNKVRIDDGALEDEDGDENDTLTSPTFDRDGSIESELTVKAVEVNDANDEITLRFSMEIARTGSSDELKDSIRLARDGSAYEALDDDDAVMIEDDDTIVISLDRALTGTKNKVRVLEGAVEDDNGIENEEFTSATLELHDDEEDNDTPFRDVLNHWAEEYIAEVYDRGIVEGRDATHYAPDANLNRAELAKLALKAFGIGVASRVGADPFRDVDADAWYAVFIAKAKELGIIGGYTNGTYGPAKEVSRSEALKILLEASGLELGNGTVAFTDTPKGAWYQKYVAFAEAHEIVQGYADGSFGPAKPVTRAEVAKIILLLLELKAQN